MNTIYEDHFWWVNLASWWSLPVETLRETVHCDSERNLVLPSVFLSMTFPDLSHFMITAWIPSPNYPVCLSASLVQNGDFMPVKFCDIWHFGWKTVTDSWSNTVYWQASTELNSYMCVSFSNVLNEPGVTHQRISIWNIFCPTEFNTRLKTVHTHTAVTSSTF